MRCADLILTDARCVLSSNRVYITNVTRNRFSNTMNVVVAFKLKTITCKLRLDNRLEPKSTEPATFFPRSYPCYYDFEICVHSIKDASFQRNG